MENASPASFGGRCVGIHQNPLESFLALELLGLRYANPHRPPPRICRWPAVCEEIHHVRTPAVPQLHALIGEAADLLPADVAERIEALLDDPKDLLPALLARMDGRDAADGRGWKCRGQPGAGGHHGRSQPHACRPECPHPGAARRRSRPRAGRARQQLSPDVVDGLLLGARELARYARLQLE
jgi:hypothetical protein